MLNDDFKCAFFTKISHKLCDIISSCKYNVQQKSHRLPDYIQKF
jgi:hypothetical protein